MLDRYPHQLSGGQTQRLMIAMALSSNPSLLIADEPTTALDVTVQATILDLLRELRDRRGMSMIFITHDLGIIAEIADQVAVMYQGHVVETGSVLKIFENPEHPYTRGLLACRPQPDRRLRQLSTVSDYMEETVDSAGNRVILAKPQQDHGPGLPPVLEISPREMQIRLESLEDKGPLLTVENLKVGLSDQRRFGGYRARGDGRQRCVISGVQGRNLWASGRVGLWQNHLGAIAPTAHQAHERQSLV